MLASHALALSGVPLSRVWGRIRPIRDSRYEMLRGYFHGADDGKRDNIEDQPPAPAHGHHPGGRGRVGRALGDLPLGSCRLTAMVRAGRRGSWTPRRISASRPATRWCRRAPSIR